MNHMTVYADIEGDHTYLRCTGPDGKVITLVTIVTPKQVTAEDVIKNGN